MFAIVHTTKAIPEVKDVKSIGLKKMSNIKECCNKTLKMKFKLDLLSLSLSGMDPKLICFDYRNALKQQIDSIEEDLKELLQEIDEINKILLN